MGDARSWFESELRKMLGFDEVEDIAKFAFESFSTSQSTELRQYLQQFLGESEVRTLFVLHSGNEEVNKLCDELLKRRGAGTRAEASAASTSAADDFWGGGSSRAAPSTSSRLKQDQNNGRKQARAKVRGKLYQKTEAEDFWGGGASTGSTEGSSLKASSPTPPSGQELGRSSPTRHLAGPIAINASNDSKKSATKNSHGQPALKQKSAARASPSQASSGSAVPASGTKSKSEKPRKATSGRDSIQRGGGGRGEGGGGGGATKASPVKGEVGKAAAAEVEPRPQWSGVTCLCMATKHDLVTNCTSCGKIACTEEGGFGCSFCGSPLPITGREPRRDTTPRIPSTGGDIDTQSPALKAALARKDKLLLFDRTSASRTRVLDDQGDYFTSHNWLSQKEREKAEADEKARREEAEQRRGARRQVKVSIDIMGRRVVETQDGHGDDTTKGALRSTTGDTVGHSGPGDPNGIDATVVARGGTVPHGTAPPGTRDQRPSLENTGLRGRAKEVYAVMRANLEKQGRRCSREKKAAGKSGRAFAQQSRLSLWRVQHEDAIGDGILQQ